ncbi:MAG: UDP-N-acetylglucosamine 2-epimerase (non-hydrolyzing) [Candidatus Riflebacteria bacterium]|nr:UDP-N-acetylglucosamine 2-epimerase (non-hydrolyzing) [Candidatus Riflebacteria bacterium]
MRICTVVGARPQFIKAAVVSRAIKSHNQTGSGQAIMEKVIHTGQHYDENMSGVFFEELDIPRPHHNLEIGSGPHGEMTGRMLEGLEKVYGNHRPDLVLVYGDTNSTLAGALAAAKMHIPVAHVEAGLRSFNRRMPEEINRILVDHLSHCLFCPTATAVSNLLREGIPAPRISPGQVWLTGDVMLDAAEFYGRKGSPARVLGTLGLKPREYLLATIHRAETTDDPRLLNQVLEALHELANRAHPVILPLHPRTRRLLAAEPNLARAWLEHDHPQLHFIEPLGYLEMAGLERCSRLILTDSGGMQKEAFFHGVPCVTLRTETEWVELVEAGWNLLAGQDPQTIVQAAQRFLEHPPAGSPPPLFGDAKAAQRIVRHLLAAVLYLNPEGSPSPR